MRYFVKTKPHARKTSVEKTGEGRLAVSVTQPASDGKANDAVVKALSAYFNTSKSTIHIVAGHKTREKIIEVYS